MFRFSYALLFDELQVPLLESLLLSSSSLQPLLLEISDGFIAFGRRLNALSLRRVGPLSNHRRRSGFLLERLLSGLLWLWLGYERPAWNHRAFIDFRWVVYYWFIHSSPVVQVRSWCERYSRCSYCCWLVCQALDFVFEVLAVKHCMTELFDQFLNI